MTRSTAVPRRGFAWEVRHHGALYVMCIPGLLLLLLFSYLPMGGMYMAFTKYNVVDGIFGSPFVGFQNFEYFFTGNPYAWNVIANMLIINFWGIILGTIMPITLAICMNEMKNGLLKKVSQSAMFFPYFLSGNPYFWNAVGNTLIINFWGLILGTILPITIAICMNEVKNGVFKKVSQSAMFFPYFLSWVVVGAILYGFLTSNFRVDQQTGELILTGANGIANRLLMGLGADPVRWYAEPKYWKAIIILLDVWKWAGYNSIIYMAAWPALTAASTRQPPSTAPAASSRSAT